MTGLCAGLWFTNRGRRVFFWVGGSGLWNIDLEPRIVWFLFLVQPSLLWWWGSGTGQGVGRGVCPKSTLLGPEDSVMPVSSVRSECS